MICACTELKKVTFKGYEEGFITCDIVWEKPTREKRSVEVDGKTKIKTVTIHHESKDVKLKLADNKSEIIEKAKTLAPKEDTYVKVYIPKEAHFEETDFWTVLEILDEADYLEDANHGNLIEISKEEIDRQRELVLQKRAELKKKAERESNQKIKKKSKKDLIIEEKDKRIAELEKENAELKSQIQMFQNKGL